MYRRSSSDSSGDEYLQLKQEHIHNKNIISTQFLNSIQLAHGPSAIITFDIHNFLNDIIYFDFVSYGIVYD
jgi:hypothetical protein